MGRMMVDPQDHYIAPLQQEQLEMLLKALDTAIAKVRYTPATPLPPPEGPPYHCCSCWGCLCCCYWCSLLCCCSCRLQRFVLSLRNGRLHTPSSTAPPTAPPKVP